MHFLQSLPREIRDQIYTCVLASPSGIVSLSPWTLELSRSLSLLQTCHQIHRECKDLIWQHTGLKVRDPSQMYQKLLRMDENRQLRNLRRVTIRLELLDRDELEWMLQSLSAITLWRRIRRLESITLVTTWERPRNVAEFGEVLALRNSGERLDGRQVCTSSKVSTDLLMSTGWPRFSHWGKQSGLKAILLDSTGMCELLAAIHRIFGGELYVDGKLCFKDLRQTLTPIALNPRNGAVRIAVKSFVVARQMDRLRN